jgi:hypothetical protein
LMWWGSESVRKVSLCWKLTPGAAAAELRVSPHHSCELSFGERYTSQ